METVAENLTLKKRTWTSPDGERIGDESILKWLGDANLDKNNDYELIIGTDSQNHGREFKFVTVVCLYKKGKGGYYYYTTSYKPRLAYKGNQQARMFDEATLSVNIANWLLDNSGMIPLIHVDASPKDVGHFTSNFSDQLKGYVTSYGFHCEIKPNSWAATTVSDKHTK